MNQPDASDVYRAHTHEDLLNALPTFFGFVPRESVIGLCVSGPNCRFGFRLRHDLPAPSDQRALAANLAGHLRANGDAWMVIAVSADADRARAMALALSDALPAGGVRLTLWADGDRVWSDLPGAPAAGEPYRIDPHHEAIVRAVAAGQVIADDRAELAAELAGPTGERARWLRAAHDHELEAFGRRILRQEPAQWLVAEVRAVRALVDRHLAGQALSDGDLVQLAVRVTPKDVRDQEWYRIDRENAAPLYELWAAVCRVAAPEFAPACLALAGFAAWQRGDGARALTATDLALGLRPDYTMARILHQILQRGVHPDAWQETREGFPFVDGQGHGAA